MTGSLGAFSLSDLFTLSLQQFISYGSGFPTVALFLRLVLLDYALVSCESLLGLFSWGEGYQFTLWLRLSDRSKRSCWLFRLFGLLGGRTEWRLSFLHAGHITRSSLHKFLEFTLPTVSCLGTLYSSTAFPLLNYCKYGIPQCSSLHLAWKDHQPKRILCSFLK